MNIRDEMRWGPLDERTVSEFEIRNGISLPADYRDFLVAHHGGVPDPNFYWILAHEWGSGIESLYGFGPDGYQLQQYLDSRESMGIASDLLVVGDDGCGNRLAIGIVGKRSGQMFYIDHEFAPGEAGQERFLAASFSQFLNLLCVAPNY